MANILGLDPASMVGMSLQQGRYLLREFLGQGSFARVYRAEEILEGQRLRDVAVKWIFEGDTEQILKEARALASMPPHQNIVALLTCLPMAPPATGILLVLEFVEGQPLDRVIGDNRPRSPAVTLALMEHVLAGLAHAHAHGVVHRDLKPENIVLRPDGALKLTDFGIARSIEGGQSTSSNIIKGTPAYMAPEQFGKEHDHRVDLYAAGVMTFELLTGRRPFEGAAPEVMRGHLVEEPPIPTGLPMPLRDFLAQSLAKSPDDRFGSAEAMLAALRGAIEQGEGGARRASRTSAGRMASGSSPAGEFAGSRSKLGGTLRQRGGVSTVVELRPEAAPPAEVPWEEGVPVEELLLSVSSQALPGMPTLAARLRQDVTVAGALRLPAFRFRRIASWETRSVVERRESYQSQPLPAVRIEIAEIDPWSVEHALTAPSPAKPLSELRLPRSDRLVACADCRERGRLPCPSCRGPAPGTSPVRSLGASARPGVCAACAGSGSVTCGACAGSGRQVAFLLLEARCESRLALELKLPAAFTCDISAAETDGVPGETMLRLLRTVLTQQDVPDPFPWADLQGALRRNLAPVRIPEGAHPLSDELVLEWFWAGLVACRLGQAEYSLEAAVATVPDAGIYRPEVRLVEELRDRARRLLHDPAEWLKAPATAIAWAAEVLDAPGVESWRNDVQAGALELARQLIDQGRTAAFRELKRSLAGLLSRDVHGTWKARWATMFAERRQQLVGHFQEVLARGGSGEEMVKSLERLAGLDLLNLEGPALWNLVIGRIQSLVKAGRFAESDGLIDSLTPVPWPVKGAHAVLAGLRRESLENRCRALAERTATGASVEELFRDVSTLLAHCPGLPGMPALLKAFRSRLSRELSVETLPTACVWSRRLHDELLHARPDLASLFANILDGNEDAFIARLEEELREPGRLPRALALLGLPEAQLTGHPKMPGVAAAFGASLAGRLEAAFTEVAGRGLLSDELELELTQALGAWARLVGWCQGCRVEAAFVPVLGRVLAKLLAGMHHQRAQPLLELALEQEAVRSHPEVGPMLTAGREEQVEADATAAKAALGEPSGTARFLESLERLVRLAPRHRLVSELATAAQEQTRALAAAGRLAKLETFAARVRATLLEAGLDSPAALAHPADAFRRELLAYLEAASGNPGSIENVLATVKELYARETPWLPEALERVDTGMARSEDTGAIERALSLLPMDLTAESATAGSVLGDTFARARTALDRKMRWLALVVAGPAALELLPHLMPGAGVSPLERASSAAGFVLPVSVATLVVWIFSQGAPGPVRLVAERNPAARARWRAFTLGWSAVTALAAFAAAALAAHFVR
jgi:hypothetical protein